MRRRIPTCSPERSPGLRRKTSSIPYPNSFSARIASPTVYSRQHTPCTRWFLRMTSRSNTKNRPRDMNSTVRPPCSNTDPPHSLSVRSTRRKPTHTRLRRLGSSLSSCIVCSRWNTDSSSRRLRSNTGRKNMSS